MQGKEALESVCAQDQHGNGFVKGSKVLADVQPAPREMVRQCASTVALDQAYMKVIKNNVDRLFMRLHCVLPRNVFLTVAFFLRETIIWYKGTVLKGPLYCVFRWATLWPVRSTRRS